MAEIAITSWRATLARPASHPTFGWFRFNLLIGNTAHLWLSPRYRVG